MQTPFISRRRYLTLQVEYAKLQAQLDRLERESKTIDERTLEKFALAKASEMEAQANFHGARLRIMSLEATIEQMESVLDAAGVKRPEPTRKRVEVDEVRKIAREQIQSRRK